MVSSTADSSEQPTTSATSKMEPATLPTNNEVSEETMNGTTQKDTQNKSRSVDEKDNVNDTAPDAPPLPDEAPPLPEETPPAVVEEDDGWAPVWEQTAQSFYFYNRFTGASQWTNPRVPDATTAVAPTPPAPGVVLSTTPSLPDGPAPPSEGTLPAGGYNPAIHGDYDPNAWYAQPAVASEPEASAILSADPNSQYAASAAFNRFTGRFQNPDINPENFNDENKSKRQMNAFFDVDAAANSHDGKSLKAERSGKKLSKTELKQFKEKRKAKKEEKRRAWLRD